MCQCDSLGSCLIHTLVSFRALGRAVPIVRTSAGVDLTFSPADGAGAAVVRRSAGRVLLRGEDRQLLGTEGSDWRGRCDHALELPLASGGGQGRCSAGGWRGGGAQTKRDSAAVC